MGKYSSIPRRSSLLSRQLFPPLINPTLESCNNSLTVPFPTTTRTSVIYQTVTETYTPTFTCPATPSHEPINFWDPANRPPTSPRGGKREHQHCGPAFLKGGKDLEPALSQYQTKGTPY
jgi:hypothetical protein